MTSFSRFVGKLMICIAEKGHFLTQIPHPMHSVSDMKAIFESGVTSIQSLPVRTTGHDFLHSCLHFFGLHLSVSIIAILIISRYNESSIPSESTVDLLFFSRHDWN